MSVQSSDRLSNNGSGAGGGIGGLPNELHQGRGGQGRVVQVYFEAMASNLQVTGGAQSQFRIKRSPPLGQVVIL